MSLSTQKIWQGLSFSGVGRKTENPGRGAAGIGQGEEFLVFLDGCRFDCVSASRSLLMLITLKPKGGRRPEQSQVEENLMLPLCQLHPQVLPGSLGKHRTQ